MAFSYEHLHDRDGKVSGVLQKEKRKGAGMGKRPWVRLHLGVVISSDGSVFSFCLFIPERKKKLHRSLKI